MEILINNFKFKLTEISYIVLSDTKNSRSILESYNYLSKGVIFGLDDNKNSWTYLTFDQIVSNLLITGKLSSYKKTIRIFIIERSKINKVEKYTEEEILIMAGVCRALLSEKTSKLTIYKKLELVEGLVRAIGKTKPILNFYNYGKNLNDVFSMVYNSLCSEDVLLDTDINKNTLTFPTYQGVKRYSIYELIDDLIKDKSFILDTCNFKLISYAATDKDINTKRAAIEWCRILGKTGNKGRANISIKFLANVLAEIPENNVGIEPGKLHLTALRNICLVRDGLLINSEIIVKVNSSRLKKKLIGAGIVKQRLVYNNELMLDLTRIPIINRDKLKIDAFDIAETEVKYIFSKLACDYLESRIYMRDKKVACPKKLPKPKKDEKQKYLESLGIYGNQIYFTNIKTKANAFYEVIETFGVLDKFPRDLYHQIYLYCNGSKCNLVISRFLKSIDNNIKTDSLQILYKSWKDKFKKEEIKLRDLRFRLLFRRSTKFRCLGKDIDLISKPLEIPIAGDKVSIYLKRNHRKVYYYDYQ